jgi:hypothetical protein
METWGWVEVKLHAFLTSEQGKRELHAPYPKMLNRREARWGCREDLDSAEGMTKFSYCRGSYSDSKC